MTDSVKFIFKTLIKVPLIIMATYIVFNLFGFVFTYFRLLGFSYVAMQTAVENNYIPTSESQTLQSYLDSMDTGIVSNLALGCDTTGSSDGIMLDCNSDEGKTQNEKVQYGTEITVSVCAKYNWIWPGMNMAGKDGARANAMGITAPEDGEGGLVEAVDEATTTDPSDPSQFNIIIQYTVPGLKYYPDLN